MRFQVYGLYTGSKLLGTYEASSEQEAITMCEEDENVDTMIYLCHKCSHEIEPNDLYKYEAEVEPTDS